jgi:hypothetical protein
MENNDFMNPIYLAYNEELDSLFYDIYEHKYSLFNEPKKINYYKIFTLSHNTTTFILTHRDEIQYLLKNNKKLLKHIFEKEI